MSESEARFLGTKWTPPDESEAPDPKVEARRNRMLAELRLPVEPDPAPKPAPKRKQPRHDQKTERVYARIRETPREVPLKEFCKRCDHMQHRFPTPKYWRDEGCPEKWFEAWQISKWRGRIHALRQNAWRNVIKKAV